MSLITQTRRNADVADYADKDETQITQITQMPGERTVARGATVARVVSLVE